MNELCEQIPSLVIDQSGQYVVTYILEYGRAEQNRDYQYLHNYNCLLFDTQIRIKCCREVYLA